MSDLSTQLEALLPDHNKCNVAVIGLGYVGLPLAIELAISQSCVTTGTKLCRHVIGFDINEQRLDELSKGFDRTNEVQWSHLNNDLSLNSHAMRPDWHCRRLYCYCAYTN